MPTRGAICWTYWYSALISQILTPKSYHRLGVFDIFSVCRGTFCNLLEQIAISGVRSVPKNTNSATILKSSPAQFVLFDMPFHPDWLVGFKHFNHDVMMCHTCAVRCTALQSVKWMNCEYMICIWSYGTWTVLLESNIVWRAPVFIPNRSEIAPPVGIGGYLDVSEISKISL